MVRNKKYWIGWIKKAGIRSIKTIAQTAIANIGVVTVMGDVEWPFVIYTAGLAGLISLLTSVAGIPELQIDNLGSTNGHTFL